MPTLKKKLAKEAQDYINNPYQGFIQRRVMRNLLDNIQRSNEENLLENVFAYCAYYSTDTYFYLNQTRYLISNFLNSLNRLLNLNYLSPREQDRQRTCLGFKPADIQEKLVPLENKVKTRQAITSCLLFAKGNFEPESRLSVLPPEIMYFHLLPALLPPSMSEQTKRRLAQTCLDFFKQRSERNTPRNLTPGF